MRHFIFIILLSISCSVYGQYTKTHHVHVDTFANGEIFLYQTVDVKQTKEFRIHEFYQRTSTKQIYFRANGNKWMEVQRIIKKGNFGRFCFELKFEQKEFHQNGKLKAREVTSCDCYKSKKYLYNEQGKLISIERTKNRWIKRAMD